MKWREFWYHKVYANAYRVYYRVYYYLYAKRMIDDEPQRVNLPDNLFKVVPNVDPEGKKHKSFLIVYVPSSVGEPKRWLFFIRKFAFSLDGKDWSKLPSLTPWDWQVEGDEIVIRYGLNRTFVQKYSNIVKRMTFVAFD